MNRVAISREVAKMLDGGHLDPTVGGSTRDNLWSIRHAESDILVLVAFIQLFTKLLAGLCDLGLAKG